MNAGTTSDNPSLRERKKSATRQAIEDAAWALFDEHGYEATSIHDIAERANVAPRTFFRYFPTKEAVMYPEIDDLLHRVRAAFELRPPTEPLMISLIAALETLADTMTEESDRNRVRLASLKKGAESSLGDYFRRRLDEEVIHLASSRSPDDPDVALKAQLASGIIGLIMSTSRQHWIEHDSAEPLADVGYRCMGLLRDLLTPAGDRC